MKPARAGSRLRRASRRSSSASAPTCSRGCATYRFAFAEGASTAMVFDVDEAVSFVARADLVAHLRETEGLALCGRGAPCPP